MKKKNSKDSGQLTPEDIIKSYVDNHDEEGINEFSTNAFNDYVISTGSLKFDQKIDGGFGPGIVRFIGPTESGKTSESLEVAKNFIEYFKSIGKKAKVIYYKCEGRLSNKILLRSGIDLEHFQVIKGRECGFIFGMMKSLIKETRDINYMFILDSSDALTVKKNKKDDDEAEKRVGGGNIPMVLANLLPQMSDILHELGHMFFIMSQHRDEITIGHQVKTKNVSASGGNALLHYPDWTIEFGLVRNGDLIKEDDGKDKEKMRVIGHTARATIKKSMNETTHEVVHYPIKRKAPAGKSIWLEREVYDFLVMYDLFKKKQAWFTVDEDIVKMVKEKNQESLNNINAELSGAKCDEEVKQLVIQSLTEDLEGDELKKVEEIIEKNEKIATHIKNHINEIPEKIHGEEKAMAILESDPNLVQFFIELFKKYGILN